MAEGANIAYQKNIELTRGVAKAHAELATQLQQNIATNAVIIAQQKELSTLLSSAKGAKEYAIAQKAIENNIKAVALQEKELIKTESLRAKEQEKLTREVLKTEQAQKKAMQSTANTKTEYQKLSAELTKNRNAAKEVALQYGLNSKEFKKAAVGVNDLDKKLKSVDASLGQNTRHVGGYREQLSGLSGNLSQVGGATGMAVSGFINMTKASLAFIATPIGAVIGAIGLAIGALTQYFRGSEEGQNAFNKITKAGSVILGNLSDIVQAVGKAIYSAFENPQEAVSGLWNAIKENVVNRFTGLIDQFKAFGAIVEAVFDLDWDAVKEGSKDFGLATVQVMTGVEDAIGKSKEAITGLIEETKKEIEIANVLSDIEAKRDLLQRKLIVDQEKLGAKSRELRLQAEKSEGEARIKLLMDAFAVEDELARRKTEIAQINLKLKQEENKLSNSTKEDLNEVAELEAALFVIQQQRLKLQRTLQTQINTEINKSNAERLKAVNDINKSILDSTSALNKEVLTEIELEDQKEIDAYLDKELRKTEILKEQEDARQDIRTQMHQEIFKTAVSLGNSLFEASQEKLTQETEAIQAEYDTRLSDKTLDEEQRDAIEAERDAKLNEQKKKERDLEKKQFLFNQAVQFAEVGIDTFKKVAAIQATAAVLAANPLTAAFAPIALSQIPLVIGTGAAAGAAILAKSIPAFDKGTNSAPGGGFLGGEERPEFMKHKGRITLIDKPTLFGDEYKGAKIWGGAESAKIMDKITHQEVINSVSNVSNDIQGQMIAAAVEKSFANHSSRMINEMKLNRPKKQTGLDQMKRTNEIIKRFAE